MPLSGIAVSFSVKERFFKLYRKLHNLFIAKELTHVGDVKLAVKTLHMRIDALQAMVNSNMSMMSGQMGSVVTMVGSHTHIVATAGGPAAQTGSASPSGVAMSLKPPEVSASAETPYATTMMETYDNALRGLGPAMAPMAIGADPSTLIANTKSTLNMVSEG